MAELGEVCGGLPETYPGAYCLLGTPDTHRSERKSSILPAPHLFLSLPEEIMKLKCRKAKRFQKGFEAMMLSIAAGG